MRLAKRAQPLVTRAVWELGSRISHTLRRGICAVLPWPLSVLPLPALRQWGKNVSLALDRVPTAAERRALTAAWLRNNLMSLSLAHWSDEDIMTRVIISDRDLARLRDSLAGPGLVLALPHMGSWDFAGAWCSRVGIKVLSVAERLPKGLYERFRDARAGMGMDILPMGQPDLMRSLVASVRRREAVCLLSDRDLSGRGIDVTWPATGQTCSVPAGPALLSRVTGCDMRVVTTRFRGDRVELLVGDVIPVAPPAAMMGRAVAEFAAAVEDSPTDWLMLQPFFRTR